MAEMGRAAEEAAGQSSGRDPCHPPRKRPEPRAPPRLLACQEAGRGRRLGKSWRRRKAPRASPGWAPFAFGRGGGLAMAAGERSGGSDRRFAQRRSPLLLLLLPLLLPVRPALGNEGGASGSCRCEKFSTEPALVRRFPDRLVTWERCRGLIRFIFPKNLVCGLDDAPWVLRLISRKRDMREGSAKVSSSERSSQPSPSSRAPLQPLSSMGSTPVVPMETLPSQLVPRETPLSQRLPALTHTTAVPALESVWSVVPPRNAGAVAEVSPTRFGQEEGVPGWHQTAVLSALGIVLLLVIVGLLCWWRPPRRGCQAALTSEQQVWMLQRPGGGPHLQAQNRSSHWLRLGRLKGTAKGNCILWIQERPPFNCG